MRTIPFLVAALALATAACETRTQRNGDSLTVTVEAEPADEVRQFREATERRLDSLDARVAELRQRAAAQTAEAKAESEQAANEVEAPGRLIVKLLAAPRSSLTTLPEPSTSSTARTPAAGTTSSFSQRLAR